jgi:hypothetical protein
MNSMFSKSEENIKPPQIDFEKLKYLGESSYVE